MIINRVALAKQGDNALGSVRLSVCPFVRVIRSSALPSAAKSNKGHYQFRVLVCVSVISGRMRIITRMQSVSF